MDLPNLISRRLSEDARERLFNNCRIFCMTNTPYNPLMWAHYSCGHAWICLEYSMDEVSSIEGCRISNVIYDKDVYCTENAYDCTELIFHKSDIWSYENETRAIYNISENDIEILDYYDNRKHLIEKNQDENQYDYFCRGRASTNDLEIIKAPCVITKKCKIKSIYLGLCISSSDRERIISSVDNSVKVWQMIQETDSYKMNKVRVR